MPPRGRRQDQHGQAPAGSMGAPKDPALPSPFGNKDALKHGFYTAEAIAKRKPARELVAESLDFLSRLSGA